MKWIVRVGGLLLLAVVFVGGVGALLPVAHTASSAREVAGRPGDVWAVMTDFAAMPEWRSGVSRTRDLPSEGAYARWLEEGGDGALIMAAIEWEPPVRLVTRIDDEGLPFGGQWTFELTPSDTGTLVRITEDGEVFDPFFRFISRFVMGHDATMVEYLDGLEARMARGGP